MTTFFEILRTVDADYEKEHRARVLETYATAEERAAANTEELITALVDLCDERERARVEEQRAQETARTYRVAAYKSLTGGDFPVRLVEAAIGVITKLSGDKYDVEPVEQRDTAAMQHAQAYLADDDKTALVLLGGVGAGKTFAATWTAYQIARQRYHVGYIPATKLEADGRYDRDRRTWLDKQHVLAIDDLGIEPMDAKGYFRSLLEEIIDDFYGSKRRLIITSNLAATTFSERYGARIWSRLCEVALIASCGTEDLRRKGGR